jgi:hypothetical protein
MESSRSTFDNVDNSAGTYRGPATIPVVRVRGTFTYAPLGFLGYLGFSAPTISVSQTERVIGGTFC